MPTFNLGATGSTDAINIGGGTTLSISGTFAGTVAIQRASTPTAAFEAVAIDNVGTPASFTAPIGAFPIQPVPGEPDAQVRATFTRTSGTAVVRIGRP